MPDLVRTSFMSVTVEDEEGHMVGFAVLDAWGPAVCGVSAAQQFALRLSGLNSSCSVHGREFNQSN